MIEKFERLFAIDLGEAAEKEDEVLQRNRDALVNSVLTMMQHTGLSGSVKVVHGVVDGRWLMNVDVDSTLKRQFQLFAECDLAVVQPADAADEMITSAQRAISQFITSKDPVRLLEVTRAGKRLASSEHSIVDALRRHTAQTLNLETRQGTVVLSLNTANGFSLSAETLKLRCTVVSVGMKEFTIKPIPQPKGGWQGKRPMKVEVPRSAWNADFMKRLFAEHVLTGEEAMLTVRQAACKRTGKVKHFELERSHEGREEESVLGGALG